MLWLCKGNFVFVRSPGSEKNLNISLQSHSVSYIRRLSHFLNCENLSIFLYRKCYSFVKENLFLFVPRGVQNLKILLQSHSVSYTYKKTVTFSQLSKSLAALRQSLRPANAIPTWSGWGVGGLLPRS